MLLVIDCPNNRKIKVCDSGIYLNEEKLDSLDKLTDDEKERLYMADIILKDIAERT